MEQPSDISRSIYAIEVFDKKTGGQEVQQAMIQDSSLTAGIREPQKAESPCVWAVEIFTSTSAQEAWSFISAKLEQ